MNKKNYTGEGVEIVKNKLSACCKANIFCEIGEEGMLGQGFHWFICKKCDKLQEIKKLINKRTSKRKEN